MEKANVVIIYADDLGYGDVGCFGSEEIETPHIDRLAKNGVRFTNWYSNSPVCSPSRASLLTGLYPQNAGVDHILGSFRGASGLLETKRTLADYLKEAGYRTAIFGKWHLGATKETYPLARGFEQFFGFLGGCVDYYSHIYYWGQDGGVNPVHDLWENSKEVWYNGKYLTELITEKVCTFIQGINCEPFFAYVPYNAPHYPMHAPERYMKKYAHLPPDKQVMAAMITAMDDGIGEILNVLEEENKLENTIIFFSSDNGPSTESRNYLNGTEDLYYGGSAGIFRGHKASLFEGGIREPAILSYPKMLPKGKVCDEMCMMMDVVPTILDLIQEEIPKNIDGKSLKNMLVNDESTPHDHLFWKYGEQKAVRKGSWKLVLNGKLDFTRTQADAVHLSNLQEDLGERNNLQKKHPDIVEELKELLHTWENSLG